MQHVPKNVLERQQAQSQQAAQDREERLSKLNQEQTKRKQKIMIIVVVAIIALVAAVVYSMLSPGKYDEFAKCLAEKGAIMYGEDWCPYTRAQKDMFGKSFKYVNYEVKTGLRVRPTWVINGEVYETVQSFDRLAELTGCRYS
ncbi:hypothetical protein HYW21_02625 [Candidatus Woesearchaeota archaeon]|nr:hypothetical protein [Candidatus Woesearchaeota archaeon]